jgi:UrcA family protein
MQRMLTAQPQRIAIVNRNKSNSKSPFLTGLRLLPFLLLISTADANVKADTTESNEIRRVAVPIADLNLDSPNGAATLLLRLRKAALQVCEAHGRRDMAARREESHCKERALERAVRSVNQPLLTAALQERQAK